MDNTKVAAGQWPTLRLRAENGPPYRSTAKRLSEAL